jgi:hypothetical protein
MTSDKRREELKQQQRLKFEETLPNDVAREIEDSREEREEFLAEQIKERLRETFEERLDEVVEALLEAEEELAD